MEVRGLRTFVVYDWRDLAVLETMDSMTAAFEANKDYPYGRMAGRWAYLAMLTERHMAW